MISLKELINKNDLTIADKLKLSANLAEALGKIHQNNIIYKALSPENILVDEEIKKVKIADSEMSSELLIGQREAPESDIPKGDLTYISPEQTGRMNRDIDYRTDYYSLGIVLYELFTQQIPFESIDPLEVIHGHLAKKPIPPQQINKEIPEMVGEIILKCLEKNPEDRYQNAYGLKADLENCFEQIVKTKKIKKFELGKKDAPLAFSVSEKVYGREEEIKELKEAYQRVRTGKTGLALVTGYAGIGKSVLVREFQKEIIGKDNYFLTGKFDQYKRNVYYHAFIETFKDLVNQILAENEKQITEWKEKILKALGENSQLMIDVIPELELIIGKQPPVIELTSTEAQNRFHLVIQKFTQVFATEERQLIFFFDDLQWADLESLKLFELLTTNINSKYLLFVGAYRDNEVDETHPVSLMLKNIQKENVEINTIKVEPLVFEDINQLIADSIKGDLESVKPLTEVAIKKTNGNPFFLIQFLNILYQEGLFEFNEETYVWEWDIEKIKEKDIADNVVDLMTKKFKDFSLETQEVLKLASCIGNKFKLETLAIIYQKNKEETFNDLSQAIKESLIRRSGDDYIFAHDRVQQVAYSLIPKERKQEIHFNIGELLLKNTKEEDLSENIFEVIDQFNFNVDQIKDQKMRDRLANLNLLAGKKAKASVAHDAALGYFKMGIKLLSKDSWEKQYKLSLDLYIEAAEGSFLTSKFKEVDKFCAIASKNAKELLAKAKISEIKGRSYYAQNKMVESFKETLEALNFLGCKFPKKATTVHALISVLKIKWALLGKSNKKIEQIKDMTDPKSLIIMSLLKFSSHSVYRASPNYFPIVISKAIILSLKRGIAPSTGFFFSAYSVVLISTLGDINGGYKYGQLATALSDRSVAKKMKYRTSVIVHGFINHWKKHLKESVDNLLVSYQKQLEFGDNEFAASSLVMYCSYFGFSGKSLNEINKEFETYGRALWQLKQMVDFQDNSIHHQFSYNFVEYEESPDKLNGKYFNEDKMIPVFEKSENRSELAMIYADKTIVASIFNQHLEAIKSGDKFEEYSDAALGLFHVVQHYFYDSLSRLAIISEVSKKDRKIYLKKILKAKKKLKKWSKYAPMNHLHKLKLIEAELARVNGQDRLAKDYYEEAIRLAKKNDYIREEALANEVAGKFYLSRSDNKSKDYIKEAYQKYLQWGAKAKAKQLEEKYPELLGLKKEDKSIDLNTVIKASQAISEEVDLDKLKQKIVQLAIESAGAEKGNLILLIDNKVQDVPVAIVNYVARTKKELVLNDAVNEGQFTKDPYVIKNNVRSILCIPVMHQAELIGVMYLENNITTQAFTSDRVELLEIIAAQAGISLENSLDRELLKEERDKVKKIFELLPFGVVIIGKDKKVQYVNSEIVELLGYKSDSELLNKNCYEVLCGFKKEECPDCDFKQEVNEMEGVLLTKDKKEVPVLKSIVPMELEGKEVLLESFVDITERKKARKHVEEMNALRNKFVMLLSHQLRTPLTSIRWNLETLINERLGKIGDSQKEFLKSAYQADLEIIRRLDDMLTIINIREGRSALEKEDSSLEVIWKSLLVELKKEAQLKNIDFIYEPSPEPLPNSLLDPRVMRKVLFNLATNAIIYNKEGGKVFVKLEKKENVIRFEVKDNGIGIPAAEQKNIFKEFFRATNAYVMMTDATGIGLAISKYYVEEHGGNIGFTSKEGVGSTFWFEIPVNN